MVRISVIIPVYNMGTYVEACLHSVMSQTLKDIEVICVNDGSTDHSLAVLQACSINYPNLIVLDQENRGVGAARNRGLAVAQGEYVAFMDADDGYPAPDIVECLYRGAKEHDALICGGSLSRYVDGEQLTTFSPRDRDYTFDSDRMVSFRDYQFAYGFQRFIYQRQFLQDHHLVFPDYRYFEDPPFLARALHQAESFYSMRKVTYGYRIKRHKTRLSLSQTLDYAAGLLDLLALSGKLRLSQLHAKMIEALHDDLAPSIYRYAGEQQEKLQELQKLASQINQAMDKSLLQEEQIDVRTAVLLEGEQITRYLARVRVNEQQFVETVTRQQPIIIYGAGHVGAVTAAYLEALGDIDVICCAVTRGTNNPTRVHGLEVKVIDELTSYKESGLVLIATYPYLHREIQHTLSELGFQYVLPIDVQELQLYGVLS